MYRRLPFFSLVVILLSIVVIVAQDSLTCDELVEGFLEDLEANCTGVGRNSACYGVRALDAEFVDMDTLPEDYFVEPGNIADVLELVNLTSSVYNPEIPEWGVALMNLQANVPNTLPGQNVTFIMMGDMELENGVEPDEAFISDTSISLTVADATIANYLPSSNSDFVMSVPAGAEVLADAKSSNGFWVRIAYDERPGWIAISKLDEISTARLIGLPMIDIDTQAPMQAFYFQTGIGQPQCFEAPSILVVQGPEDFAVDITANGAQIRIDSTIALRTVVSEDTNESGSTGAVLELITLSGEAVMFPDTDEAIVIPAGEILVSCLTSEEQDLGIDNLADDREVVTCNTRELTDEEIAEFNFVTNISSNLLNYPVVWPPDDLPTPTPTPTEVEITATIPATDEPLCTPNSDWTGIHTVMSGETLTSIANLYDTDIFTLAEANCLINLDVLIVGQGLLVPALATATPQPATDTPVPPPPPPPPLMSDLEVILTASNTTPLENGVVTFTITASNNGANRANTVSITDTLNTLGANFVFGAASTSTGTYNFGAGTWSIPFLDTGTSATMTISATVRPTSAGTIFNATASGSANDPPDSNPANNSSAVAVTVAYGNILVNTLNDTTAVDGFCSLREAIVSANTNTASGNLIGECRTGTIIDTIDFFVAGSIMLNPTELQLTSSMTINGSGITVEGAGGIGDGIMIMSSGIVTINDITLRNGTGSLFGGAIESWVSNLTLNNVTIENSSTTALGGAVRQAGGTLTINNSTFRNNSAGPVGNGGAIASSGTLIVTNSTFDMNTANNGGAIYHESASLFGGTIIGGSFINNSATTDGGAIYDLLGNGELSVTGVTFNNNTSAGDANCGGENIEGSGNTFTTGGQGTCQP